MVDVYPTIPWNYEAFGSSMCMVASLPKESAIRRSLVSLPSCVECAAAHTFPNLLYGASARPHILSVEQLLGNLHNALADT